MRELLERLCALNAVSSWEDEVRAFLLAEVEPHADRLRVDALGNLIAWKKGRKHTGSKLLLTAHMDEVGLMIRQITDDGYLKFDTVGAIDRRVLLGKPVLVGPKRVPGVVGLKAYHLVSREEEKSVPKLDEFYIDIGARDRAGAYIGGISIPTRYVHTPLEVADLGDVEACAALVAAFAQAKLTC